MSFYEQCQSMLGEGDTEMARAGNFGRRQGTYLVGQLSPFPRHAGFNITFYEELRRSGFIEGKNLTIYYRDYGLRGDLILQYAAESVKAQVDVLLVGGGVAVRLP